ncbi:hypothetical protein [Photobacterium rosenbergii]|uniref:TM2 domain-containing protein n=1 Tax=Photobacterium rosenbergii TaxID=294936 RepID=A0ABU3ZFH0_9GAMM|nr:hypothetical protein [Photobacterium rosenbergii]MDV5168860.1 hypothetical protein [Photobacterium rosenbergii]
MKCIAVWLGTNYTNGQHKKIAEKVGEDIRKNRMGGFYIKLLIICGLDFCGGLVAMFFFEYEQKN